MKLPVALIVFSLPIAIVLTNLLALTFSDYTYKNYFASGQDLNSALNIVNYLRVGTAIGSDFFSNQAVKHMVDVKSLFDSTKIANALTLLVLTGTTVFFFSKKRLREMKKGVVLGIIILTLLILFVFTLSLLDFNYAFIIFHKVFFRNDLWLFPPNDSLVKLFSISFFVYFTQTLITNILLTMLIILILLKFIPKNDSKSN